MILQDNGKNCYRKVNMILGGERLYFNSLKKRLKFNSEDFFTWIITWWSILNYFEGSCLLDSFKYVRLFFEISNRVIFILVILRFLLFGYKIRKKKIVYIVVVSIIVVITVVANTGNLRVASLWIFIIAANNIDLDSCIRRVYRISLICFFAVIFMFLLGIIPEYTMYRGSVVRHSLGFAHPNILGIRVFQLMAYNLYIYRNNLNVKNYILAAICILFSYKIPNAQASVVGIFLLMLGFSIYQIFKVRFPKLLKSYSYVLFCFSVLANIVSIYYGIHGIKKGTIIMAFDNVLSNRLSGAHHTYLYYGISIFGQKMVTGIVNGRYFNGDNVYMLLLMQYGFIVYFLFSIAYFICLMNMIKKKKYAFAVILSIYALYGIMQNDILSLSFNIFLLAIAELIYDVPIEKNPIVS